MSINPPELQKQKTLERNKKDYPAGIGRRDKQSPRRVFSKHKSAPGLHSCLISAHASFGISSLRTSSPRTTFGRALLFRAHALSLRLSASAVALSLPACKNQESRRPCLRFRFGIGCLRLRSENAFGIFLPASLCESCSTALAPRPSLPPCPSKKTFRDGTLPLSRQAASCLRPLGEYSRP